MTPTEPLPTVESGRKYLVPSAPQETVTRDKPHRDSKSKRSHPSSKSFVYIFFNIIYQLDSNISIQVLLY